MSNRQLSPQELIIKELLEEWPNGRIYDVSTLRFLRVQVFEEHQVHCIICSTTTGEEYGYICVLHNYEKSWMVAIMTQYNILNWSRGLDLLENDPDISFSMDAVKGTFFAFARVQSKKCHTVKARLESSNTHFLEGFIEEGFVFFVSSEWLVPPIWMSLYDETGACIKRVEVRRTIFG